jgi:gamma-glutamylcyclotransferase (GGCT)/AIG2-like uncharacterized protein YtfP
MNKKIAVYGSLREGMGNYGLIAHAIKLSTEDVELPFAMADLGGFPGLYPSEEKHKIKIEVFEVDENTFKNVERLEGYPNFYDRANIDTSVGTAGIYFLHNTRYSNGRMVEKFDGVFDWTRHYNKKVENTRKEYYR